MKRRTHGRWYDTETATKVASYNNGAELNGPYFESETLYRKRTGEYFLYGKGGEQTPYAVRAASGWVPGDLITPVTRKEAVEWAKEHMNPDAMREEFSIPDKAEGKGGRKHVGARISPRARALLNRIVSETGMTQSDVVENAICEYATKTLDL